MGVALENARLFDETQRLLKETEQRTAELAVINSIQQGIAAELNFQAIVDLVGDKLREVLKTDDIGIAWHDPQTNMLHHLYTVRARPAPRHSAESPQARRALRNDGADAPRPWSAEHVAEHAGRGRGGVSRAPTSACRR